MFSESIEKDQWYEIGGRLQSELMTIRPTSHIAGHQKFHCGRCGTGKELARIFPDFKDSTCLI